MYLIYPCPDYWYGRFRTAAAPLLCINIAIFWLLLLDIYLSAYAMAAAPPQNGFYCVPALREKENTSRLESLPSAYVT